MPKAQKKNNDEEVHTLFYALDKDGEPTACPDIAAWAKWFDSVDHRIRVDEVGKLLVMTIFIGIDHNLGLNPENGPVLWEAVVFSQKGKEKWSARYKTKEKALRSHDNLVKALKNGRKLEGIER